MKQTITLAILLLLAAQHTTAQQATTQPQLPDFTIADTSGHYHNIHPAEIKRPILLIYFLPDCDDCRAFTKQLVTHRSLFTQYKVIMITNASLPALKHFVAEFKPDITKETLVGTEGWTNTILRQQAIRRFPYAAIYKYHTLIRPFTLADH
jgi:hypothetical protein